MSADDPTIVFAGDRNAAVEVAKFLIQNGVDIACLLVPDEQEASHSDELVSLCNVDNDLTLYGDEFRSDKGIELLNEIDPDYILSIHLQYIYPETVLSIPTHGVVNLHPAYLPYNRGWHTPSWAIFEDTPYGATLHFMTERIDAGPIIARKQIQIYPEDTADSLYNRVFQTEVELFKQTWPQLADRSYETLSQAEENATTHQKQDLQEIQEIDLDTPVTPRSLINRLRALTTNKIGEAAYYELNDKRYRIQVNIVPESQTDQE
jgi:methionyl-tRNA formyltransferase